MSSLPGKFLTKIDNFSMIPCQVCGDRSSGKHYGAICCDGCSCFFKRSIRKGTLYACIAGKGNCVVDKARRNWCPYCRLQRCFGARMNIAAVQEERGPRKSKNRSCGNNLKPVKTFGTKLKSRFIGLSLKSSPLFHSGMQYQILVQILVTCIKQAKINEQFKLIDSRQQNVILLNVWSECFILRASHWSLDITAVIQCCGDFHLKNVIDEAKGLRADLVELSFLESLILCRKEFALNIECANHLDSLADRTMFSLAKYVMQQANLSRFGHLLLGLRNLALRKYESSLQGIFQNVVKDILKNDGII